MAKKSKIVKNEQRKRTVAKYAPRRRELLAIIKDPNADWDDKATARHELDRIAFRHKALNGELPGIRKASW